MSDHKNWIEVHSQLSKIVDSFDLHTERIQKLLNLGYSDEAIILTVVVFEVLLKDMFKTCREAWIHCGKGSDISHMNLDDKFESRKKIKKYLEDVRAYDRFLKNYYVYQCDYPYPENETLYQTLFGGNNEVINFQNIKDDDGAYRAYKVFFNIDLMKCLHPKENVSHKKWDCLKILIEQRHQVVHSGVPTTLTKDEISDVLQSLIFMKGSLKKTLFSFYRIEERLEQSSHGSS
jgi:hypothetical protein